MQNKFIPALLVIIIMLLLLVFSSCSLPIIGDRLGTKPTVTEEASTTAFEEKSSERELHIHQYMPSPLETTTTEPTTEETTTEAPVTEETTTEAPTTEAPTETTTAEPVTEETTTEEAHTLVPYSEDDDEITRLAKEVINGKYGNGQVRKDKLKVAGYDYKKIQTRVNEILGYTEQVID